MPGPPPKHPSERRRRHATVPMTKLPAEGRRGPAPRWPGYGSAPELWGELWRTPQAVAWERNGWHRMVARYAQVVELAEETLKPQLLAEARQLEDRLGLNPLAMLRLRWEVVADEVAERRVERVESVRARPDAVDPEAATGSG